MQCPACAELFVAPPLPCVPVALDCGHYVCALCVEASEVADCTECYVCERNMCPWRVDLDIYILTNRQLS